MHNFLISVVSIILGAIMLIVGLTIIIIGWGIEWLIAKYKKFKPRRKQAFEPSN